MGNALEEFRAQRQAVEDVKAQLLEVAGLLRSIRHETTALARDQHFRELLDEEQAWLVRAQELVRQVQRFREIETSRFWPAVWRRWAVAVALVVVAETAAGAGYVWAGRPYERQLASLRGRAEFADELAQRILRLTPAQRKQVDALLKSSDFLKP